MLRRHLGYIGAGVRSEFVRMLLGAIVAAVLYMATMALAMLAFGPMLGGGLVLGATAVFLLWTIGKVEP